MSERTKFILPEEEMPTHYYNIAADMPNKPMPPLNPQTREPMDPSALEPLFPKGLIEQEVSTERFIEIPEEVRDIYKLYRPAPLVRARALEKALGTPAKIYYKYEGGSPSGSHKPNTAIAQAYYNAKEGVKRITTETGAGQWGSALSFACQKFGIDLEVYMVRLSYDQKPYRAMMMHTYGANVYPSPSNRTEAGKKILAQDPDSPGSLGIAISEAIEVAAGDEGTKYSSGGGSYGHIDSPAAGATSLRQAYECWKAGADPIEWAKENKEFGRAFESFPQDADKLYPGWREKLGVHK